MFPLRPHMMAGKKHSPFPTTAFVLGAGASMPYGFPSGRQLLMDFCRNWDARPSGIVETLRNIGFEEAEQGKFRTALDLSMQPSVDAFVESRPEFLEIGKAVIAAGLIPFENESRLSRQRDHTLYEYLFASLRAESLKLFPARSVSFVTFNYDRSLEFFFIRSIVNAYGVEPAEAGEILKSRIRIVHMYGQLGGLPDLDTNDLRPYRDTLTPETVKLCMTGIRIIGERSTSDTFEAASQLLGRAQRIAFLGFGFHPTNVKRLGIDTVPSDTVIYACGYGLSEGEKARAQAHFGQSSKAFTWTNDRCDALETTRQFGLP